MNYVLILLSLIRNGYCFTKLNLMKRSMRQAAWHLSQLLVPKVAGHLPRCSLISSSTASVKALCFCPVFDWGARQNW